MSIITTYGFERVGGHVDIVNVLVGFLEGVHHGRLKRLDGCLGGLGIIILQVEKGIVVASVIGSDKRGGRNKGKSEGGKFHHGGRV